MRLLLQSLGHVVMHCRKSRRVWQTLLLWDITGHGFFVQIQSLSKSQQTLPCHRIVTAKPCLLSTLSLDLSDRFGQCKLSKIFITYHQIHPPKHLASFATYLQDPQSIFLLLTVLSSKYWTVGLLEISVSDLAPLEAWVWFADWFHPLLGPEKQKTSPQSTNAFAMRLSCTVGLSNFCMTVSFTSLKRSSNFSKCDKTSTVRFMWDGKGLSMVEEVNVGMLC